MALHRLKKVCWRANSQRTPTLIDKIPLTLIMSKALTKAMSDKYNNMAQTIPIDATIIMLRAKNEKLQT